MRRQRRVLGSVTGLMVACALVIAGLLTSAAPASADGSGSCASCSAGSGTGGYTVTAAVHFSGDAAPGGGGTVSMGVPASCWWAPYEGFPSDPSTWIDWYNAYVKGLGSAGEVAVAYFTFPKTEAFQAAVARAQAGEKITLYAAHCTDDDNACKAAAFVGGATEYSYPGMKCGLPLLDNFFPVGGAPAPQVDPADLARIARDHMVIPDPNVERNPKVAAVNAGTLVGLPTWFWVTNADAVGGVNGTRTIRADVGNVWAEVVAKTGGLSLTSPAGGQSCAPEVAMHAYAAGAADSSGCTVDFKQASVGYAGGYPVQASTAWTATWTGSGGTRGDLDGLARNAVVNVPVAETQALVNRS